MNEYEKSFVARMNQLTRAGYDFGGGSRAALEAKFGGAADVLLRGMSSQSMLEPGRFASELSRTFGRGSIGFLEPIIKYADMGMFPMSSEKPSAVAELNSQLPAAESEAAGKGVPLHDQRVKDDESKYADEYD